MKKYPNATVKLLLRHENQVLMLRHENGAYDFPGGRMEWKESIPGTLKRELIEELDYSLDKEPKLFDVWNYISKDKQRHSVFIYYIYWLDKKPKLVSQENAEILWLTKKDMESLGIIKDKKFRDKVFKQK